MTRPFKVLLAIAVAGFLVVIWRFLVGLGPTTGLSDGYPFGIWIAFDVVTGTALACGGYAVAILVYILNKGRYHPLVRAAILTSALGYTLAGLAIAIDVGRPWWMWKIPLFFWNWNLNSALLEVALCVMAYILVLWLELSPAFLESWEQGSNQKLAAFARKTRPIIEKSLLWIIALGLLLPTMHQSSLGTVMLIAGPKLHPLWNTPMIPLLFLVSCIAMGYAVVAMESTLSSRFFNRESEASMLASLSGAAAIVLGLWVLIRLIDVAARGALGLTFEATSYAAWFWAEILLAVIPIFMLTSSSQRRNLSNLFRAALLIILGGALFRFVTYLVAYDPVGEWAYVPTIPELVVTLGLIATEILLYIVIVKRFPILAGRSRSPADRPTGTTPTTAGRPATAES